MAAKRKKPDRPEAELSTLTEDERWNRPLFVSASLVGSKRAIRTANGIWISPAMHDLIKNPRTLDELRTVLAKIEIVDMPSFSSSSGYAVTQTYLSVPSDILYPPIKVDDE